MWGARLVGRRTPKVAQIAPLLAQLFTVVVTDLRGYGNGRKFNDGGITLTIRSGAIAPMRSNDARASVLPFAFVMATIAVDSSHGVCSFRASQALHRREDPRSSCCLLCCTMSHMNEFARQEDSMDLYE